MNRTALSTLLLLAAGASCLLYTDPINESPRAGKISWTDIHLGQPAALSLVGTSDDGPDIQVQWAKKEGECPAQPAWPEDVEVVTAAMLTVTRNDTAPFCVWARVVDHYGATSVPAMETVRAVNRPPVATLHMIAPFDTRSSYPLQTKFRFSARDSYDPDGPLPADSIRWTRFTGPPTAGDTACPDAVDDPTLRCFAGDVPGLYHLEVTVTDHADATLSATASADVLVNPDQPPCLKGTIPATTMKDGAIVLGAGEARSLQVTWVEDDLDPWPAAGEQAATFRWWMRRSGSSAWEQLPGAVDRLDIAPNTFNSEEVQFCVAAFDRETAVVTTAPCQNMTPQCANTAIWTLSYR